MMKRELEDLAGDLLRDLEDTKKNKKRIARWYDKMSKLKSLPREIWFGNLYY
jgi:hypothetical protein